MGTLAGLAPASWAMEAPPNPAMADRQDDLAVTARDWRELRRMEGPVIDLAGPQHPEVHPVAVDVAYRIHGDRASVEGTLLIPDEPGGTPLLHANTGIRFHWVTFDPPLVLKDGSTLEGIEPFLLDWSERTVTPSRDGAAYGFQAEVPMPDDDGWSPPREAQAAMSGLVLAWQIHVVNGSYADPDRVPVSPANARLEHTLELPEGAVDDETRARLDRTNVTFAYRFDFAQNSAGIAREGPAPLDTDGIYLIRGQAVATLRFLQVSHEPISERVFTGPPGRPDPQAEERTLSAPLSANATLPLTTSTRANVTTHGARVLAELGYLYQFPPAPTLTPSPVPTDDDAETPGPSAPLFVLLVGAAVVASRMRRLGGR